jgi:hypothetical protein
MRTGYTVRYGISNLNGGYEYLIPMSSPALGRLCGTVVLRMTSESYVVSNDSTSATIIFRL